MPLIPKTHDTGRLLRPAPVARRLRAAFRIASKTACRVSSWTSGLRVQGVQVGGLLPAPAWDLAAAAGAAAIVVLILLIRHGRGRLPRSPWRTGRIAPGLPKPARGST